MAFVTFHTSLVGDAKERRATCLLAIGMDCDIEDVIYAT